jgi:hypothetical protein
VFPTIKLVYEYSHVSRITASIAYRMSVSSLDVEAISSAVIAFDQFYGCSNFVLSQAINLLVQCRNVTILSLLIIDLVWLG